MHIPLCDRLPDDLVGWVSWSVFGNFLSLGSRSLDEREMLTLAICYVERSVRNNKSLSLSTAPPHPSPPVSLSVCDLVYVWSQNRQMFDGIYIMTKVIAGLALSL